MGVPRSTTSVHDRVSTTLERLERLMGQDGADEVEHATPETVEEAVRRLKGKLPDKTLRQLGD